MATCIGRRKTISVLYLLRYSNLRIHTDATFKMAPKGWHQCLILSIIDEATKLHVPIFFVLMTTKTEEAYNIVFQHIQIAVGKHFMYCYIYNIAKFLTRLS